jgi:hypothetical protein
MLLDQAALVIAACATCGAALRVAAQIVPAVARAGRGGGDPVEWILIAAPLAAGFVVAWTLAMGLMGLSGSVVPLALGPVAAWAAARWLPAGPSSLLAHLMDRWACASRTQRMLALTVVGVAAGCVVDAARQPALDVDAVSYHLADVVGWLHSGHAGSAQTFSYDFPFGYYPVTNEVLLTWVLGISRSFAPLALWATAIVALGLLAVWRILQLLRVPHLVAAAAIAAVAMLPVVVAGLTVYAPNTDVPAFAWLACAAALSARAPARPALLAPALIAAGLAVGTKTNVGPLAAAAVLIGVVGARSGLGSSRWWLLAGAAGAVVVGAPWFVRDALRHGWPFWPFSSGPTGDPLPHALGLYNDPFLARPVATVSDLSSTFLKGLAGGIALIAATFAIPVVARSRAALLAAAAAVASLLVWAASPFTGVSSHPELAALAAAGIRYLLGALAICAVAIAVAARDGPLLGRRVMLAVLVASIAGSVAGNLALGSWDVLRHPYIYVGGAVGAAAGAAAAATPVRLPSTLLRFGLPALAVVFLALSEPGWLWRSSRGATYEAPVLAFMLREPGFDSGSEPVSFAPTVLATLAGPRLRHPISLIGASEGCARVRGRLRRGWIVVKPNAVLAGVTAPFDAGRCLRGEHPVYADGTTVVYPPKDLPLLARRETPRRSQPSIVRGS